MVLLWDVTAQHSGWQGTTFAAGGWQDTAPVPGPGIKPGSLWLSPLNGQATDIAVGTTSNVSLGIQRLWFNQHVSSARQVTLPADEPILTPGHFFYLYTRVPQNTQQILVRVLVSDQPVTSPPADSPCRFGTQPKPTSPISPVLTPELINLILAPLNLLWRAIAYLPLHYSVLNVDRLCSRPPPPLVTDLSVGGLESIFRIQQDLDAVSWPYFCECVPGAPTPVPYPPPSTTQPPSWPVAPTFDCDPADICGTLALLRQELAALRGTVGSIAQVTTLTQRYGTPFAYIPGAVHAGLVGEGSFPVPRIVGLHLRVTSPPPARILQGNPDYWWDQGWVSLGNEQGMYREQRVARPDHVWLPDEAPTATRFNWSLTPGVTLDVRELYAEP